MKAALRRLLIFEMISFRFEFHPSKVPWPYRPALLGLHTFGLNIFSLVCLWASPTSFMGAVLSMLLHAPVTLPRCLVLRQHNVRPKPVIDGRGLHNLLSSPGCNGSKFYSLRLSVLDSSNIWGIRGKSGRSPGRSVEQPLCMTDWDGLNL